MCVPRRVENVCFYLDSAEYLGIKDMKNVFVKIAWH